MSNNIYNITYRVPLDWNTYKISDMPVQFLRTFKKEYNEIFTNQFYNYDRLLNTDGVYQSTEFVRKDPITYIKLKDSDNWLYENVKGVVGGKGMVSELFFDKIRMGDYDYLQPLVLWIDYVREGEIVLSKLLGYNAERMTKTVYDGYNNVVYIKYEQQGDKIKFSWVNNINQATKFLYDRFNWDDYGWIKLESRDRQDQLLSRRR
jgi:hypothetical protein